MKIVFPFIITFCLSLIPISEYYIKTLTTTTSFQWICFSVHTLLWMVHRAQDWEYFGALQFYFLPRTCTDSYLAQCYKKARC